MRRVDLEESSQVLAGPAPPEAVGPEREVVIGQPARDHVGELLDPVRRGDDRATLEREDLAHDRDALLARIGMEPVPALGFEGLAAQQRERRGAVDLGRDAEPLGQQVTRGDRLLEDRAGPDEPGAMGVLADLGCRGEAEAGDR